MQRLWDRGDAVLPLPWDAPAAVVDGLLTALRPARLVERRDGRESDRALAGGDPVAAGTALVVATSGTTGEPRGVELSHAAVDASVNASLARLGARQGERWLCCLPLHHVAGLAVLLRSSRLGTDAVVHDRFDAEAVLRSGVGWVSLVPAQLERIVAAEAGLAEMPAVLLGGGPVAPELVARASARGCRIVVSYGMTETCGGCVYDGVPLDGAAFRVDAADGEVGRVLLRGPMLLSGYRGRPDLTAAAVRDGWLLTSDLGRTRPGGALEVVGRSDDVIVTGGENVVAATVATVVGSMPGIADVVVVGRPDPRWGEIVVAIVARERHSTAPSLEELRAAARDRLAAPALPRALAVVEQIPRDRLGKVPRGWLDEAARSARP